MYNKLSFTLLLSSLLSIHSFAQCPKLNPNDPFEVSRDIIINGKKDCLRTNKRSIKILNKSETLNHIESPNIHSLYIANFFHQNKFRIAEIPYQFLESAILQKIIFKDLYITEAAHTQLRFKFMQTNPIILFDQTKMKAKPEEKLNELILSIEAIAYEHGPSYGLLESMKNPFVAGDAPFKIASRARSLEDVYLDEIVDGKHVVNQFELNPKVISIKKLLLKTLLKFHKNFNMNDKYDLIFKNCTNELFIPIDSELKRVNTFYDQVLITHPALVLEALKKRNILLRELKVLDKEFTSVDQIINQ